MSHFQSVDDVPGAPHSSLWVGASFFSSTSRLAFSKTLFSNTNEVSELQTHSRYDVMHTSQQLVCWSQLLLIETRAGIFRSAVLKNQ